MGHSLRARWPLGLAIRALEPGLVALALGPAMAAGGCGRIGYEPLGESVGPADGGRPARDAPAGAETGSLEASGEATVSEAGEGSAPQDASPDVLLDAGPDGDGACSPSAVVDYCASIPPLPGPPVVDGVLDCGPALVPIVPEAWRGAAPLPPFPAGNTAEVAAAWRPDGLYVFLAVTTPAAIPPDPTTPAYFGAGVEIFVDDDGAFTSPPAYDAPGTIQTIVTSPPLARPDASTAACPDASGDAATDASMDASTDALADASATGQRGERYRGAMDLGPWTSTQFGTFATPTGFVFEGFVAAADLGLTGWSLAAGGKVGFDVAVDVSFPTACTTGLEGHRAGQYFLHVPVISPDAASDAGPIQPPYVDVRSFCTPTLTSM
jgi:hypothetical protein